MERRACEHPVWLLMLAIAAGCATAAEPAPVSASDPRDGAADASRARRVADWKRLSQALSGLPCKALGVSGDDQRTSIVIPADCLFAAGGSVIGDGGGAVVSAIARELKQLAERDFWIAARPARGSSEGSRFTNARASAVMAGLVAAGVPAARVAAVVGVTEMPEERGEGSGPAAGTAVVEIMVAPDRDELSASGGSARGSSGAR